MNTWQLIETAPKDCSPILAYCVKGETHPSYCALVFWNIRLYGQRSKHWILSNPLDAFTTSSQQPRWK